jgi:hypothetical protein
MERAWFMGMAVAGLFLAGCAKRQSVARIVFVHAAPPPALRANPEAVGALVVAEPQSHEPTPDPAPPPPEAAERPVARPRVRLAPPDPSIEPEVEAPPAAEVPTLEPREGAAALAAQRRQATQFHDQIRARIARQDRPSLSADERRMLADARTFLAQSERALGTNDFQRALTLARKASLLLAVIEQQ